MDASRRANKMMHLKVCNEIIAEKDKGEAIREGYYKINRQLRVHASAPLTSRYLSFLIGTAILT